MDKPTHVYVGYAPCGCSVAIVSYSYKMRNNTASVVSEFIREGLIIKCLTWNEYQEADGLLTDCPHGIIVDGKAMQPALGDPSVEYETDPAAETA